MTTVTTVTVTTRPNADYGPKTGPGAPDFGDLHDVMLDDDNGTVICAGQIRHEYDGWSIGHLVYGAKIGAALDCARRFVAADHRSPFEYATTDLTYKTGA